MVSDNRRAKGGYPGCSRGASSPQEKRPGHHAREALLFFCVHSSAASVARITPLQEYHTVLSVCVPRPDAIADDLPRASRSVIAGHRRQTAWSLSLFSS
jgi:hypothetical protein